MKENLVQKLDLLEVQLAKIEGRNENPARLNRTRHLLERWEKAGNLSSSHSELTQQINSTKQELASRKKYYAESSIKKILKQFVKVEPLRIAKRKKAQESNADKLANLDQELTLVNQMDLDTWSREVVERFMTKKFVVSYGKRNLTPAEINIFARIGKMDAVKKALSQLEESVAAYLPQSEAALQSKESTQSNASQSHSAASEKPVADAKVQPSPPVAMDDFTNFDKSEEEERQSQLSEDPELSEDEEMDPFFQERIGLPQLREGYVSGSDDESDIEEPEKPARRNRRGQRARRKIWEQKFGTKANHVIKEEQLEQEKQREKALRKRKRDEKQQQFKRQKLEFESKPIHPSWEAKQKLKEQQKSASFQGKKIQFD